MITLFRILASFLLLGFSFTSANLNQIKDNGFSFFNSRYNPILSSAVQPDTWAAVDGLGRTVPTDTGEKDREKFVGVFYWNWHSSNLDGHQIFNTTRILEQHPEIVNDFDNPLWNDYLTRYYYWEEPIYGYYSNFDVYVLRKQAELLADAGVNVIVFDATNDSITWMEESKCLLEVFADAVADGVNVPKIAWMLNFADNEETARQLTQLYDEVYSVNLHPELWFQWHGKPLVMSGSTCLDIRDAKQKKIHDCFTFRRNEWRYFTKDTTYLENKWGWCSVYEQTKFGRLFSLDYVEQMAVSVAQNSTDTELVAMNNPDAVIHGRSYSTPGYSYSYEYAGKTVKVDSSIDNSVLYGIQFQQQWDYAIETDPEFIFVTGWNEWIASRFESWQGTENAFPDEFSAEYSRDIEPTKGILKDNYYYQLVSNIRRFKGTGSFDPRENYKTIDIAAGTEQWADIYSYEHYVNSTLPRNCSGSSAGVNYTSDTMRNDICRAKVAHDEENVFFYLETKSTLATYKDNSGMRIYIDTDPSGVEPNWEGFEYVLMRTSVSEYTLLKSTGGWAWQSCGTVDFTETDKVLQISVPLRMLGLTSETYAFNFKVTDNTASDGDIMEFYTDGDVAPGGRFTFVVK